MKRHFSLVALLSVLAVGWAVIAVAHITTMQSLRADFTDGEEAKKSVEWSEDLDLTKDGLGIDGKADTSRNGWILTQPLATGTAWRPAREATVEVKLQPVSQLEPWSGWMYVRYSPDRSHWSSWQELESNQMEEGKDSMKFHGKVGVPQRARAQYDALLLKYGEMDVSWPSDEEAAVRWIVGSDPNFFAKELPFVGYVQFLCERRFSGGLRLRSLEATVGCSMGGHHLPPKDPEEYKKHDGEWRYVAP